jgi:hypothetical protein
MLSYCVASLGAEALWIGTKPEAAPALARAAETVGLASKAGRLETLGGAFLLLVCVGFLFICVLYIKIPDEIIRPIIMIVNGNKKFLLV